jgi:hypothetical protein
MGKRQRCDVEYIKRMTLASSLFFVAVLARSGLPSTDAAANDSVDHTLFGELLVKHVREGVVDYAGFKAEEKNLDRYLSVLENTDPDTLGRNEQFAFYINASNAWTIKLILSGYPGLKSIKELGSNFQSPCKRKSRASMEKH